MARFSILLIGFLHFCFLTKGSAENKYENYSLVRLVPKTGDQLKALHDFVDPEGVVEVLKVSRDLNDTFDALVPTNGTGSLRSFAGEHDLHFQLVRDNYGRSFEQLPRISRRYYSRGFNVFSYNSYNTIQDHLKQIKAANPDLVTLQHLGKSYQGRSMKLVKISADPNAGNPIIFVDAGIHAREWVAPSMAMYLIHRLTSEQARNKELRGVDWHILPVVNPDGYEFTRSSRSNRLWRKTRSKTDGINCYGVDGNRNYGFRWGISGVSSNPCNMETYAGPKPFSEPETQMVRDALMEHKDRIKLYVSLHSYGQYLVYPWGYTGDTLPKEWKKLDSLAKMVSQAVVSVGGSPFKVMSAGKWYPAAGGSDDFAFGAVGVPYSYTMELTDGYEFQFPEPLLQRVLPQFYEGFKVFANQIRKEFNNNTQKK